MPVIPWPKIASVSIWFLFFSLFCSASGIALGSAVLVLSGCFIFRRELVAFWRLPLFWPTFFLVFALALSIALAPGTGFEKPLGKLRYLFFYFFIGLYFARYPITLKKMADASVVLGLLLFVVCVSQFAFGFCPLKETGLLSVYLSPVAGTSERFFHARGLLYHHNPFAYGALFLFCLIFGRLIFTDEKKARTWYFLGVFALLACIAMSGSRGSWISLLCALSVLAVWVGGRFWKSFLPLAFAGGVVLLILSAPLAKRFASIRMGDNTERVRLWEISWKLFQESPWVGNGYHLGFEHGRERYMSEEEKQNPFFPTDPHSLYFDLLATTGLIGLGAFLVYLGSALTCYRQTWRKPSLTMEQRATVVTGVGALVCFAVGTAFDSHFFHTQTLMATVFILGVGQSVAFRSALR